MSWFTGMWSQISVTLNQSMVRAQCVLLIDASYRILREPKKIKGLRILIKSFKYPKLVKINYASK